MMHIARSWLLLAAVAMAAALFGFATPALAHGGHNSSPAVQAAHTAKQNAHDIGKSQNATAEVASQLHQDGAKHSAATCCGLSCMTAVPQYAPQLLVILLQHSSVTAPLQPELLGRGPARVDRPPTA